MLRTLKRFCRAGRWTPRGKTEAAYIDRTVSCCTLNHTTAVVEVSCCTLNHTTVSCCTLNQPHFRDTSPRASCCRSSFRDTSRTSSHEDHFWISTDQHDTSIHLHHILGIPPLRVRRTRRIPLWTLFHDPRSRPRHWDTRALDTARARHAHAHAPSLPESVSVLRRCPRGSGR